MLYPTLLWLHLLGAIVWVGGMAFAQFALRPSVEETLAPPQRIALMTATLRRFFRMVAVSAVVVLATGFAMYGLAGAQAVPLGWHAMAAIGVLMALVFVAIVVLLFPRLVARAAASDWPAAGAVLKRIRTLVGLNLVLGVLAVAAAALARL
jgi:uncharacterized membrane protein